MTDEACFTRNAFTLDETPTNFAHTWLRLYDRRVTVRTYWNYAQMIIFLLVKITAGLYAYKYTG